VLITTSEPIMLSAGAPHAREIEAFMAAAKK